MVNEFGGFLKKQRLERTSISLNKFAKELGISAAYLSKLETGKEKPTFQLIQKIAKLLEMDENLLAGRAGVIDPKIIKAITSNDRLSTSIPKLLDTIVKSDDQNRLLDRIEAATSTAYSFDDEDKGFPNEL